MTDPQQRAKYDAQRIRKGQFATYTEPPPPPPRNAAAGRAQTTGFPPPPKPPPPPPPPPFAKTAKTAWSPKFKDTRKDPRGHWAEPNEAKSKTNDFKAWEHMRHGTGPLPRTRNKTSQAPKPAPTRLGRDPVAGDDGNGSLPRRPASRRTEWEDLPDAGMPKTQRTNTARMAPKSGGFAPSSPGIGDEGQAHSAYFHTSKGERPTFSRTPTNMGPPPVPPPPGPVPRSTARPFTRKPVPLQTSMDATDGYVAGKRGKMPYPTVHGERTDIKSPSPGLRRTATSATPRDSNSRTGFYDSEPLNNNVHHSRAASANSARHFYEPRKPGSASLSTTSSESSSEDDDPLRKGGADRSSQASRERPKATPKSQRPGPGAPQRSFFNPHVKVEDAEDETMAPHTDTAYNGPRRHSGIDMPTYFASNLRSEGFMEHRRKHEAEQAHQPSSSLPNDARPSPGADMHPMSRPRSFDGHYPRPSQDERGANPLGSRTDKVPMYESFPSSFHSSPISSPKWSDTLAFDSPQMPHSALAEAPPDWIVPPTFSASFGHSSDPSNFTRRPSCFFRSHNSPIFADFDPFVSFRWGQGDLPKPFAGTPPLRSQSSDRIDLRFSPSGPPPQFKAGGEGSPSRSGGSSDNPIEINDQDTAQGEKASEPEVDDERPLKERVPPPPQGPACFFPKDWHHRFTAGTFSSSPSRSRGRSASQNRPGVPRTPSVSTSKGNGPRPAAFQPTVDEAADEPPQYSSANIDGDGNSRPSSDGSAMDIDPVLTPPSAGDNQHATNEGAESPTQQDQANKPFHRAPTLPPRNAVPVNTQNDSRHFNMDDLKNSKPFGVGQEGLGDVGDLKFALPFESRASPTKPIFEKVALPSKLPKPPKAPTPPAKLNITTWELYIRDMNRYMSNWANFNDVMLSHFHARQEMQRQMGTSWINGQGDGEYNLYLESVAEDKKVHKYWEVALDLHKECIEKVGEAREAMKAEMLKSQPA